MNNSVISVQAIRETVNKLETEFMNPLARVSDNLISTYKDLNASLQSETINQEIARVQQKFDELRSEFKAICDRATAGMEESAKEATQETSTIEEVLPQ